MGEYKNTSFLMSIDIPKFFTFKLFLNIGGVTMPENQKIILKSLLMLYFIIKQNNCRAK